MRWRTRGAGDHYEEEVNIEGGRIGWGYRSEKNRRRGARRMKMQAPFPFQMEFRGGEWVSREPRTLVN